MAVPTLDIKGKGATEFATAFVGAFKKQQEHLRISKREEFQAEQRMKMFTAEQKRGKEEFKEKMTAAADWRVVQKELREKEIGIRAGEATTRKLEAEYDDIMLSIEKLYSLQMTLREDPKKHKQEIEDIGVLLKEKTGIVLDIGEQRGFTKERLDAIRRHIGLLGRQVVIDEPEPEIEREPRDLFSKAMGFARVAGLPLRPFREGISRIFDVINPEEWSKEIEKLTKGMKGKEVFKKLWGEEETPRRREPPVEGVIPTVDVEDIIRGEPVRRRGKLIK